MEIKQYNTIEAIADRIKREARVHGKIKDWETIAASKIYKGFVCKTGVKDLNGNMIYNGDVVKPHSKEAKFKTEIKAFYGKHTVKFADGSFYIQSGKRSRKIILSGRLVQAFGLKILSK